MNRVISALCDPLALPRKVGKRVARFGAEARWRICGYDYLDVGNATRMKIVAKSNLGRTLRSGGFEQSERIFLSRYLKPGDLVVDVGANDGLFTLMSAPVVGEGGSVVAFEPSSETFQRLLGNIRINRLTNVTCVKAALSDVAGHAEMHVSCGEFDAWNSLAGRLRGGEYKTEFVEVRTWDEYHRAELSCRPVTFMKIDVEGWEAHVLRGASSMLSQQQAPALLVEFTRENAEAAGTTTETLFAQIQELGYDQYLYNKEANELVLQAAAPLLNYCNVVALKRDGDHRERVRLAGIACK